MLSSPLKYFIRACFYRACLPVILLLISLIASSQQGYVTDSVVIREDTVVDYENDYESEPPPPEAEEFNNEIFIPRSSPDWSMDSIQWRKVPDSVKYSWKDRPEFWYAGLSIRQKPPQQTKTNQSVLDAGWFKALLWLLTIVGFILFVIVVLSNNNSGLFRKGNKNIRETETDVETDDIFAINYQREIDKAANSGNYRFAIRLMFLQLLKNLSEKNIIQYKHDRTNFDYLMQLSSTRYYDDFFRLTRNYEYSWYGQFDVNPDMYKKIKTDFEHFEPALK